MLTFGKWKLAIFLFFQSNSSRTIFFGTELRNKTYSNITNKTGLLDLTKEHTSIVYTNFMFQVKKNYKFS